MGSHSSPWCSQRHILRVLPRALHRYHLHNPHSQTYTVLRLQPHYPLCPYLLNDTSGLYATSGLRRETHSRCDNSSVSDRISKSGRRNNAIHFRRCSIDRCHDSSLPDSLYAPGRGNHASDFRCGPVNRHVLRVYYDYGGFLCGSHSGCAQLSSSKPRNSRDAILGEDGVSAVVTVDITDESAGAQNHTQNHNDEQQNEGAGAEGALFQEPLGQRPRHRRRLPSNGQQHQLPADAKWRGRGRPSCVLAHLLPQYAAGAGRHPQGDPLHHQPNAQRRRGAGDRRGLAVRGHGRGSRLPHHVLAVHRHIHVRLSFLSTSPHRVTSLDNRNQPLGRHSTHLPTTSERSLAKEVSTGSKAPFPKPKPQKCNFPTAFAVSSQRYCPPTNLSNNNLLLPGQNPQSSAHFQKPLSRFQVPSDLFQEPSWTTSQPATSLCFLASNAEIQKCQTQMHNEKGIYLTPMGLPRLLSRVEEELQSLSSTIITSITTKTTLTPRTTSPKTSSTYPSLLTRSTSDYVHDKELVINSRPVIITHPSSISVVLRWECQLQFSAYQRGDDVMFAVINALILLLLGSCSVMWHSLCVLFYYYNYCFCNNDHDTYCYHYDSLTSYHYVVSTTRMIMTTTMVRIIGNTRIIR